MNNWPALIFQVLVICGFTIASYQLGRQDGAASAVCPPLAAPVILLPEPPPTTSQPKKTDVTTAPPVKSKQMGATMTPHYDHVAAYEQVMQAVEAVKIGYVELTRLEQAKRNGGGSAFREVRSKFANKVNHCRGIVNAYNWRLADGRAPAFLQPVDAGLCEIGN